MWTEVLQTESGDCEPDYEIQTCFDLTAQLRAPMGGFSKSVALSLISIPCKDGTYRSQKAQSHQFRKKNCALSTPAPPQVSNGPNLDPRGRSRSWFPYSTPNYGPHTSFQLPLNQVWIHKLGVFFVAAVIIRALLFGVCIRLA